MKTFIVCTFQRLFSLSMCLMMIINYLYDIKVKQAEKCSKNVHEQVIERRITLGFRNFISGTLLIHTLNFPFYFTLVHCFVTLY